MSSRRSRRSSHRKGGKGPDWKKSKPLMYTLISFLVIFWIYMLFGGSSSKSERVRIPQAFFCAECNKIVVYEDMVKGHPPYECPFCQAKAVWPAFTCTECKNEDGSPVIFPNIVHLPEGVEPPAPGEEPSMEYMDAMMMAEGVIPECPVCGRMETVERYLTPEAKKMLEELRKKYRNRRKK